MAGVLVDSSAWVDFFRGTQNPVTDRVASLLSSGEQIAICPIVLQEVLQGFKSTTDYDLASFHLNECSKLHADAYQAAEGAAQIFRDLRKKGITVRKSSDCLIAWYAIHARCAVLHKDRDFDLMVKPLSLKVLR